MELKIIDPLPGIETQIEVLTICEGSPLHLKPKKGGDTPPYQVNEKISKFFHLTRRESVAQLKLCDINSF